MPLHRDVPLYVFVAALAAMPAIAQTLPVDGKSGATNDNASAPDFSGTWQHPAFPWF
jgi:hypothetical protein